jgi:hypothetical protein
MVEAAASSDGIELVAAVGMPLYIKSAIAGISCVSLSRRLSAGARYH